jgi:protoheme IX farnesyltransferase
VSASSQLPIPLLAGLRGGAHALSLARDYLALTRPRVLSLALFTAPPALVMGMDRWPDPLTAAGVLLGAALVGGGCGAFNAWLERGTDRRMARTRDRPLPTGRLEARQALGFGVLVSALGLFVLYAAGGWLPTLIGAITLVHYVFVYTVWLKPRTPQNIVIGGAAGAFPPMIGWAAATGEVSLASAVLFAIIFLWTPPHFWAIALYRKREYEAAHFPMLPNVVGDAATRQRMLAYALVLIPVTLLPWLGGALGPVYAVAALGLGVWFAASIARAMRAPSAGRDRRVFAVSIQYLALLFGAMLVELALR